MNKLDVVLDLIDKLINTKNARLDNVIELSKSEYDILKYKQI